MKKLIAVVFLVMFAHSAFAEVVVVVHPSNANTFDSSAISRIFLGKSKSFPDGSQVIAVNQGESAAPTGEFNSKVLKKSASQLKAYWSKLVFTGKGTPPNEVPSDTEVLTLVSSNPSMIGYIDAEAVNDSVKVVATF